MDGLIIFLMFVLTLVQWALVYVICSDEYYPIRLRIALVIPGFGYAAMLCWGIFLLFKGIFRDIFKEKY